MNMNKMQKMDEMMSKMSESEKMMMREKMTGMCMCHDCSTMKDCDMNMNMDCSMPSQKGLFCSMDMAKADMLKSEMMDCMCNSCKVASDMGMSMMSSPCMGKK